MASEARKNTLPWPELEPNGPETVRAANGVAGTKRRTRHLSLTETLEPDTPSKLDRGQDYPDFEITDFFPQTEQGGVQNRTLFYLTSSSLNVALMASNVADIARWTQRRYTAKEQGPEILVILCVMLAAQIGMLLCFCFKMYQSTALQTILDRTITTEERLAKEGDVLKSLGFGNKLTVLLIALAIITSVMQVAYKILTNQP